MRLHEDRARVDSTYTSVTTSPGIDAVPARTRRAVPYFTTQRVTAPASVFFLALVQKIVVTHNGRVRVLDSNRRWYGRMDVTLAPRKPCVGALKIPSPPRWGDYRK
jgi:hypothetical protein